MKTTLATVLLSALLLSAISQNTLATCTAPAEYQMTIPEQLPLKVDVCQLNSKDDYFQTLFNFGTKPEWINNESFVFIDNNVGNLYLYDLTTRELRSLSNHFSHSGFNRVHRLANNDLLLVGTMGGSLPDDFHPLIPHETNMFDGYMYVLQHPYDGVPQPLGDKAWEGVAVAKSSMKITYAQNPHGFFYSEDEDYACNSTAFSFLRGLIAGIDSALVSLLSSFGLEPGFITYGVNNLCHYAVSDPKLFYAEIKYDDTNNPYLANKKLLVDKFSTRNSKVKPYLVSSLEAQNFAGESEEMVTYSSYGPTNFVSSLNVVNIITNEFTIIDDVARYAEWEGVNKDLKHSVVEIDPSADPFKLTSVENYIYSLPPHLGSTFSAKLKNLTPLPNGHAHELVFSPDGSRILGTTTAYMGWESAEPGYGNGIILHDYLNDRTDNPEKYSSFMSPMAISEPLREIVSYSHDGLCLERKPSAGTWFAGSVDITFETCDGSPSQKWYFAPEKKVYQSANQHLPSVCMGVVETPISLFNSRTNLEAVSCTRSAAKRVQFDGQTFKDKKTGKSLQSVNSSAGFEDSESGLQIDKYNERL